MTARTVKPRPAARNLLLANGRAGDVPSFVAPQLCKRASRPPVGENWIYESKLDGYRMQLRVHESSVTLRTRKGLDWTGKFSAIARAAQVLDECLLDGELVAIDARGVPSFSALQVALSNRATQN